MCRLCGTPLHNSTGRDLILSPRFQRLSREGFWVLLGQVVAILGALGGVRVLTELLDPTAYGELALGMTAATLVNQVIFGPLGQGASRFFAPANDIGDVNGYALTLRKLLIHATWISALLILLAVMGMSLAGNRLWVPLTLAA